MGIAVSLILIAVGAILTWAVNADVEGIDITVVGVILMIIGLIGFILTLLFWSEWSPYRRRASYVEGAAPVRRSSWYGPRRTTYVEEDEVGPPGPPPGAPPPPPP